jgi:hypothetical protein
MRAPPASKLEKAFRLTRKEANLVRRFAKAVDDRDKLEALVDSGVVPSTEAYVRQMYNSPYNSFMWRVTVALHAIDNIVDGYGVEGLGPSGSASEGYAPPYEYINFGDPYVTTLIYKRDTDTLFIGSWGDIVEREGFE